VKRALSILPALLLLSVATPRADEGYRVYESTAASVNGEVIFVSDVMGEACFFRCAAMPGTDSEILSAGQARDRLVLDTLALQEQRKLLLGTVDNAVLEDTAREAEARMAACPSDCSRGISPGETREWVRRQLLLRDFYNRRVAVFVEVKEDDVRREFARRSSAPGDAAKPSLEELRDGMLKARIAQAIRNWQSRAASKARMILSPMEDR
jgi:hypothetical protein